MVTGREVREIAGAPDSALANVVAGVTDLGDMMTTDAQTASAAIVA